MPYVYDAANNRSVYYAPGTKPPSFKASNAAYATSTTGGTTTKPTADGIDPDVANHPAVTGSTPPSSQMLNPPAASGGSASTSAQNNAYEYLRQIFEGYGLGSLAPKILEYIQKGYDSDTISLMLQDTQEYKTRFAANEQRKAAGMSVLSPAEYLGLERQYRQLLSSAGLPAGFFDSNSDFTSWIAGDVSPTEIQERVGLASAAINSSDNFYVQTLRSYGLGDGDLAAYMLDSKRALPLLQKTVRSAQIGAEAARNSLGISQDKAAYYADLGVTGDQARNAYSTISEYLPTGQNLGQIYGEQYGQTDMENELLGQSGLASAKRKRLALQEAGAFSGASGVGTKAFSGRSRGEY